MRGRRGAKNNPRDYGIARNFESGLRDLKNHIGDPLNGVIVSHNSAETNVKDDSYAKKLRMVMCYQT